MLYVYADVIGRPENIYVSETKYLKYQQNIEGKCSFRKSKCKKFKARSLRSLAYS